MEDTILVNISKLFPFLHSTCKAINLAYQVLDASCYDHQNVLKRWILPIKEESCKCSCKPCFDEPEEMVNDIECAVERAKATRKTLMQVKDSGFNISDGDSLLSRNLEVSSFKDIQKGKGYNSRIKKMEKGGIKRGGSNNRLERGSVSPHLLESWSKLSVNTKINKGNTFQTTYQKDFAVQSSCRTQLIKNTVKRSVNCSGQKPVGIKLDKSENIVNVDSLLDKISMDGVRKNCSEAESKFAMKVEGDNCFLHGGYPLPIVQKCVSLKEAMDLHGIPPEFVKLLKTYYQYINVADKLHTKRKGRKESFLHKLNCSNKNSWCHAVSEPVIKLCLHYLLVFVDIVPKKNTELNGTKLKELEEEFSFLIQSYNKILNANTLLVDDVLPARKKSELNRSEDKTEKWHWSLIGMWNRKCWSKFSEVNSKLKVSYNSKDDYMSLHKRIQDIQKLQLQIEILKFLQHIFPDLSDLEDDHVALAHLYKACIALCNISSVSVPILLKT